MPGSSFALTQIGQIAIPVRELERAVDFYSRALGMQHLFTASSLAFFDCGGIRLMLSVPEAPEFDHPSSIIYFSVHDIEGAHQDLIAQGVQFDQEPHMIADMGTYELWMAFFRDSEGNLFGIMAEVPHAEAT